MLENIKIENPETIKDLPADTRYVIANENHAEDIRSQIESAVDRERIFIF